MRLIIEFPMQAVRAYNGADNLDATLDENISYLVQKYFMDNQIDSEIIRIDFIEPVPNTNDEMVRYEMEVDMEPTDFFKPQWIVQQLEEEGFEKGVTIKNHRGEVLYADEYTADIAQRRKMNS